MHQSLVMLTLIVGLFFFSGDLSAGNYASYDGVSLPKQDLPEESLFELMGKSVERIYLEKKWEKVKSQGREFAGFEDYRDKEWPKTRQAIDKAKTQLISFKDLLSSYTLVKDSVTTTAFYESLTPEIRKAAGVKTTASWERNFQIFQSPEDIDRKLKMFPQSAEQAYQLYGDSLDFTSYKEGWVKERLTEIDPELNTRLSWQAFVNGMTTSTNPLKLTVAEAEKVYENTKNVIFAELSLRLVLSKEMEKITFSDTADTKKFKDYWRDRIQQPLGRGLVPEKAIPVEW